MPKCVIPSTHNTLHSKSSVEREKKKKKTREGCWRWWQFRFGGVARFSVGVCVFFRHFRRDLFPLLKKSFFATSLCVRGHFTEMGAHWSRPKKSLYLERENEKTKNKLRRRDADVSGACHYEATCDTVHTHRPKLRKKKLFQLNHTSSQFERRFSLHIFCVKTFSFHIFVLAAHRVPSLFFFSFLQKQKNCW